MKTTYWYVLLLCLMVFGLTPILLSNIDSRCNNCQCQSIDAGDIETGDIETGETGAGETETETDVNDTSQVWMQNINYGRVLVFEEHYLLIFQSSDYFFDGINKIKAEELLKQNPEIKMSFNQLEPIEIRIMSVTVKAEEVTYEFEVLDGGLLFSELKNIIISAKL